MNTGMNTAFIQDYADVEVINCRHAAINGCARNHGVAICSCEDGLPFCCGGASSAAMPACRYEREAPNMSRAASLKRGGSAVNTALNRIPVHLLPEGVDA